MRCHELGTVLSVQYMQYCVVSDFTLPSGIVVPRHVLTPKLYWNGYFCVGPLPSGLGQVWTKAYWALKFQRLSAFKIMLAEDPRFAGPSAGECAEV